MKNIQHLINQMFEERENESTFGRNWELTKQLCTMGPKIVNPILTELFKRKKAGELLANACGSPVFHLITTVVKFAEPQHAQRLAEMLLWDEIALDEDPSKRSCLLQALQEIGDISVIPLLQKFVEKVKEKIEKVEEERYFDFRANAPKIRRKLIKIFIPGTKYYYCVSEKELIEMTIEACRHRAKDVSSSSRKT
jgi:hypothetical protein